MTEFEERYGPWALVTGAAKGVGLAYTEELLARGLHVVMVDLDPEVTEVARGLPGRTLAVELDVTAPTLAEDLEARAADLDIGLVVANAGVSHVGRFAEMTAAERHRLVAVNCGAVTELAAWAVPRLIDRGGGGLAVVSSGSALAGTAGVALYSATKAFVTNLAEAIGYEVREFGVDVQAVIGPSMDTPAFRAGGADLSGLGEAVDPAVVVRGALDALGEGGRWLPDDGLRFLAGADRADQVEMLGNATMGMYPHIFAV